MYAHENRLNNFQLIENIPQFINFKKVTKLFNFQFNLPKIATDFTFFQEKYLI